MLTNEKIIEKVTKAFAPLRCIAEIWDYEYQLRFKVFDKNNKGIIEVPSLLLEKARRENELDQLLEQTKMRIEDKGFTLNS